MPLSDGDAGRIAQWQVAYDWNRNRALRKQLIWCEFCWLVGRCRRLQLLTVPQNSFRHYLSAQCGWKPLLLLLLL